MSNCAISDCFKHWLHTPIELKKERCRLAIITTIVVAIIVLGALSYTTVGGKFADIPGYNQIYAYVIWTIGGVVTTGTIAAFIARHFLSKQSPRHIPQKPVEQSFEEILKETQYLTKNISTKFIKLDENEAKAFNFLEIKSPDEWDNAQKAMAIFADNNSPFVCGHQAEDHTWFMAARIECHLANGTHRDGVLFLTKKVIRRDIPSAPQQWSLYCKIEGVRPTEMTTTFLEGDNRTFWREWAKAILEGKQRGMVPFHTEFSEDAEAGTISLWQQD